MVVDGSPGARLVCASCRVRSRLPSRARIIVVVVVVATGTTPTERQQNKQTAPAFSFDFLYTTSGGHIRVRAGRLRPRLAAEGLLHRSPNSTSVGGGGLAFSVLFHAFYVIKRRYGTPVALSLEYGI